MTSIDLVILAAYFGILIFIGWYNSRKQDSIEHYFLGGRQIGAYSIMTLWLGSWIGGASIVGAADKAYALGVASIWYPIGMTLGCLIFAITVAGRINATGEEFSHITYPDFIEKHYGVSCRLVATISTILAYFAYTASQLFATAIVITMITGWSLLSAFIASMVVIVFYSALGGYLALASTNRVQAMLIIFGVTCCAVPAVYFNLDGQSLVDNLPASYFSFGEWSHFYVLGLMLSTVMTFFTSMDSYSRCFSAKTPKAARNGTLLAAAATICIGVSVCYVGMAAQVIQPPMEEGGSILAALMLHVFPSGVRGLLLVAILSATMGTASTCMLTASANITRDLYQRFFNPNVAPKKAVRISMCATAFVGIASAVLAWYRRDVIDLLFMAFTLNSAGLFLPTIAIFFKRFRSKSAAFWSMLLSLFTVVGWYTGAALLPESAIFSVDPVWPGLAASAITFVTLNLVKGKASPESYTV